MTALVVRVATLAGAFYAGWWSCYLLVGHATRATRDRSHVAASLAAVRALPRPRIPIGRHEAAQRRRSSR